ncbi:outer membrane beta-barrel protein [Geobacter sp. SVR]|uniref:outer membrane beta-barrel protein n=1 Tax=Geobacter sp. SVR TaxID=2495594 RepID=UPI00143EFA5C|nr:outer membrane beta-barrel protein [Geobacter sp. SVR]BCS54812.1 hypothetical protein GSVR_31200 [Geobacter sp. SVR]GCF86380.1 hypothetical protein GSbR_29800 [Geobacter sp. SVR]
MKLTRPQSLLILLLAAALTVTAPAGMRAQEQSAPGGAVQDEYTPTQPPEESAPGSLMEEPGQAPSINEPPLAPTPIPPSEESAPGSPLNEPAPAPLAPVPEPAPVPAPAPLTPAPGSMDEAAPGSAVPEETKEESPHRPKPTSYLLLKGGFYAPKHGVAMDKLGGAGELAVGQYILPALAVELGAGYFQTKNSPAAPQGTLLRIVPVVATGKAILPLGAFEPYGLFGIGAYIADLDVHGTVNNFSGSTEVAFGLHAGGGFNLDVARNMFVGAEGKYLWSKPEFGGRDIRLDGFISTLNVGFRF